MTSERVEAAIEVIARNDPQLARWAENAADALTAGEGEESISQAALQSFLWYYLPKKWEEEAWSPLAEGAAVLLDELGLERYAAITRSSTTMAVLDAWRRSRSEGFRRFRASMEASGVAAIDTEVFAWGNVMGMDEASALSHVEQALERAITSGEMTPGAKGWKQVCRGVCGRAIQEDVPHLPTQSWLSLVITERVEHWVDSGRPAQLRQWRESIAKSVLVAPEPPEDLEPVVAAMRWLLEACRQGVELTQAGYLPPSLVKEAIGRFFDADMVGNPRSEADVHQLGALRETASRMGALSKRRRALKTSAAGLCLLGDPVAMWRAIAANLDDGDALSKAVSELIAHRLLRGAALDDDLEDTIAPIVLAHGWHAGGIPITEEQARYSVHRPLYYWRLFGLLNEQRPRWESGHPVGRHITELNVAGRATALALLHARATGPRRDVFV
jgi:hypothetical protein